jgi:hypothetical protein
MNLFLKTYHIPEIYKLFFHIKKGKATPVAGHGDP